MLLVFVYLGVTYGWPWLSERLSSGHRVAADDESGNPQAQTCVRQVERALADFKDKVSTLGGSQVQLNWREAMRLVEAEIDAGRRACRCDSEACVDAADALATLKTTKDSFGATVERGGTPHDVAAQIGRIESQLARARSQLEG